MVTYLGKFISKLSQETAPLRELLKKNMEFVIQKPQKDAFDRLKTLISTTPVLQYYNPNLPTRLRSDSSRIGLGAMIEQEVEEEWHHVAFSSRVLNTSEHYYAQIERETLSVVFGCERFREYVYGRQFIIQNDYKPLKSIFSKSVIQCPPRIQRFFLRPQKYNFLFEFAPGKTMKVTDALSRVYSSDNKPEISTEDIAHYVHSVLSHLPISEARLKQFQQETAKDSTLQVFINYTINGWPSVPDISPDVKCFYSQRHEIVFNHDLLLKGQRIIVPSSLRSEVKHLIHQGHLGVDTRCR